MRSLSVRACRLSISENEQLSLLPDVAAIQKQEELESAVDALRPVRPFSIRRGILLADRQLSGLNPKDDHIIHPESFSKLKGAACTASLFYAFGPPYSLLHIYASFWPLCHPKPPSVKPPILFR